MSKINHIELELTAVCNMNCVFCPRTSAQRRLKEMSDETFLKVLENIDGLGIKFAYAHLYGDPLCSSKFIPRVNVLSRYIKFISVSTNALLLNEFIAKQLFDSNLSELTLALDSLDKKTYESIRRGGKFETVKYNIDEALKIRKELGDKSKVKVELQVIVTKQNEHEIPEYIKQYGWLDEESWGKLRIKPFSTFAGNVEDMSPEATKPMRYSCKKLEGSTVILWNGDVVGCCRCFDGQLKFGNINDNNLLDIFNSPCYNNARSEMKNHNFDNLLKFCTNC